MCPGRACIDSVSPDIMHDILEGVDPLEVKLVLSELIAEGHISLNTLNYRITSFDYGFVDRCNKPSETPAVPCVRLQHRCGVCYDFFRF